MNMAKSIGLTERETALIAEADRKYDAKPRSQKTRRYVVIRNRPSRNWDVAFLMVAVRHFNGERRMKTIAVTSVDGRRTFYNGECDIISNCYGSAFRIGWREHDLTPEGKQKEYAAYGRMWWFKAENSQFTWGTRDFNAKGKDETRYWMWWSMPLNWDEAIAANPRFRYNSFDLGHWTPLAWLRLYSVAPEVENFAKMGVSHLASKGIVAAMRKDKGLFRYFRENLDAIRAARWTVTPSALEHAYRHGLSLDEELNERNWRKQTAYLKREFGRWRTEKMEKMPSAFDWRGAARYIDRKNISAWEYARYLGYCVDGGADLLSPQTAFPRDLERRLADFDRADELRRRREERARKRKEAKERKGMEARLVELAKEYVRKCSRIKTGGMELVFPTSAADFVREGRAMGNCIGGGNYTMRHADKQCVCVFIRIGSKPFVDVEIVGGRVCQCYARGNEDAPVAARKLAEKVAKSIFGKNRKAA